MHRGYLLPYVSKDSSQQECSRIQGLQVCRQVSSFSPSGSWLDPPQCWHRFGVGFLHRVATGSFRLITSTGKKVERTYLSQEF